MLRSENVRDDDVVEKAGMASPALAVMAALASRRSFFCFRARAFLPDIALDAWTVLCAGRCGRGDSFGFGGFREERFCINRLTEIDTSWSWTALTSRCTIDED